MRFYTKYRRKLCKFTEYCKDQWFYARRSIEKACFKAIMAAAGATKLLIFMALTAMFTWFGENIWVKYHENHTAANTVFIMSMPDSEHQGSATGFEIRTPSGKILTMTNAHVCALANKDGILKVGEKKHSGRMVPKRVIEVFADNDLCLVEGLAGYDGLELADSVDTWDAVTVIGYPLGEGLNISTGLFLQNNARVLDFV
jgi:S1-C subfamily serine protease